MAKDKELELVKERVLSLISAFPPGAMAGKEFWGAQFDAGLAWVQFPPGHGGLNVAPRLQVYVNQAILDAGGSLQNRFMNIPGIGMGAATLVEHGTEAQLELLRPMFTGEEIWCQLFSEPGAGSDLAGLSTSARNEDGVWIVRGQKVWTTLAHIAKWGLLLARTDPDQPKHEGLTYFVLDMESEGIEVRPLYQITGEAEFNEVYIDGARIPDRWRVGDVGEGWAAAMTTLTNERVALGGEVGPRGGGAIGNALRVWRELGHNDPALRDTLTRYWIEAEALRLTSVRASEARNQGAPGPEGSTTKLHWAKLNQAVSSFTVELLGAAGMTYPGGYPLHRPQARGERMESPYKEQLRSLADSIAGGTSEIQKNILGERVLELPKEPRTDRDIPWHRLPRN